MVNFQVKDCKYWVGWSNNAIQRNDTSGRNLLVKFLTL